MVIIKEVKSLKEIKQFVNFPLKLYKNSPYYVPELYIDAINNIKHNFEYKDQCKTIFLLAYIDNKIVGRIEGIIQLAANKKWNQKRVRFTRFDSINDQSVANALFDAVSSWAYKQKIEEIVGPLGYSDLEREGLLIEGFDNLSTFEETYNFPYYKDLIENYGFVKEVDWIESKLSLNQPVDEKYKKISEFVLKKYNLHYSTARSINEFIKKYKDKFFAILDETYENIYGTVPFTKKMQDKILEGFKLIVKPQYVCILLDSNENPVAFGICFPSIAKSINKCKGKLFPFGFIKVLHEINHPSVIDLGLMGVKKEYQKTGVLGAMIYPIMEMIADSNIGHAETNLNLETNTDILAMWKYFNQEIHKKRRAYIKKIHQ